MACSFIAATGNTSDAGVSTLDASGALNVAAGDVLVVWAKHEGANTTFAMAKDAGSPANTFTFDAGDEVNHSNGDLNGAMGYLLSAAADASATFRLTLGASRAFTRFVLMQFRPDSGDTVTKDTSNTGQGTSLTPTSGAITTTGTDEIVVGGYGEYDNVTTASETINGVAATEPTGSPQAVTSAWYRLLSATFTGGTAAANIGVSRDWICNVLALKAEAAGGGGVVGPLLGGHLVQRGILQGRLARA